MFLKKLLVLTCILVFTQVKASAEAYMYGGAKVFNYGIEDSDLQEINTSLVSLGFSSSTSSTDNSGVGFDIGFGAAARLADRVWEEKEGDVRSSIEM